MAHAAVRRIAETRLPTDEGEFRCVAFEDESGETQLALGVGDVAGDEPVLVRLHSECMTGDVFGSRRCDCGPQLHQAMALVQAEGRGIVVYLRGHEGRGIGIGAKLMAYELQDAGRDTVDANLELGFDVDSRDYAAGAAVLRALGASRVRLLTNNPRKADGLTANGVEVVELVAHVTEPHADNATYLATKRDRLGHQL